MKKLAFLTIISLMFVHSTIVSAETWDTTWGPVTVRVDNNNRFIAFFNDKEDGIIDEAYGALVSLQHRTQY